MKIHIFYRHYNIEKTDNRGRPHWFDYEKCFKNLLESLEDQWSNPLKDVILHVIFDGNIKNNFINKYKDKFTTHQIEAGSDQSSFFQTWEIAKQITMGSNDLIYFLENDYLHTHNWVEEVVCLFSTYKLLHYVSLYDHNDKYILPMYDGLVSKILTTKTHHWRNTPSTCGSFIITRELLELDYDIHTSIPGDHNKFLQLAEGRNRGVITPIPGLSTHCMEGLLSPTINWKNINN
tara:strand:- start:538 stop:1239 length:702 start_codon:yes stop_codon:yes gene_type:complete